MLAAVRSATVFGVEGRPVTVEVHVSTGLPAFQIVGLPDEACRESRDRVRAAVLSSGLRWPSCRVTVNLAPSSQRKGGSGLDLAIAVGFLAASEQVELASLDPVIAARVTESLRANEAFLADLIRQGQSDGRNFVGGLDARLLG